MIYIVKSGDSLSLIARDQTGSMDNWQAIANANAILPPYTIQPGQTLIIPDSLLSVNEGRAPLPNVIEVITGKAQDVSAKNRDLLPLLGALAVGGVLMLFTSKGRPKKFKRRTGPGTGFPK